MKRKRERLHSRRQRPILSDTLPFELPASFSNRHIFELLRAHDVQIIGNVIRWECSDDRIDDAIYILTGIDRSTVVNSSHETKFGKVRTYRNLEFSNVDTVKEPFAFEICHREAESRKLSIPHPFSQILVANFYNDYSDSIIYYARRSPFSIRHPDSIARYSNHRDRMHERLLAKQENFEEVGKEYDQIGSFFAYRIVNNVFKFFESFRYHRAEKRFDAMMQADVSKCFDSIYTHSLPWAVLGKRPVKDDLKGSLSTFPAMFDKLMQNLNHAETNGIIIGPEFCRIFAEIILQSVDVEVEKELRIAHGLLHRHDYEIFRYVDDYYIFFNSDVDCEVIIDVIGHHLSGVKLSLNRSKTKLYEKPVITEITIAKSAISDLISKSVSSDFKLVEDEQEHEEPVYEFVSNARSRELIIGYKTILKSASVSYPEVGNYTFALLESTIDRLLADFVRSSEGHRSEQRLIDTIENILEFAFFIYAAAPRVNLSIRLARIVSVVSRALRRVRIALELRHHVFKYAHDNIVHQLRKNQVSNYREVETLYLLTALGELGREYWLDEDSLCQHLNISKDKTGLLCREQPLTHLTITVTLLYVRRRTKYNKLRRFLIEEIARVLTDKAAYARQDTEVVLIFLDAIACPYIDDAEKSTFAATFGLTAGELAKLSAVSKNWFTTWSGFNLSKELDAKRYRDVY
ncbi:antiviral reverse transcriptase Drt3b [Parasphingopyxis marina]|uniref:RNA-directed DNA polymerase n=1 Tax=Parasphingopyxis marina TaxID=2761622 RepID=A0A842HZ40_9SPHN|nr:antiviral reverse transcriptase Drt3b [Parasphingopyxis marina]MBC2776764.1 RNA-directed DNA polymerase [Parasphingopyxis marina]